MTFWRNLVKNYETYAVERGRKQAHEVLMRYDDRLLSDIGISRTSLKEGISAWPWRSNTSKNGKLTTVKVVDQQLAMRELQKYSDNELKDLGITRGTIGHAVRFGRDGIDVPPTDKVA